MAGAPGAGPRRPARTGLLGATCLAAQGYEWPRLLTFGLTAPSGIYGGTFYTLVGAHAVHVLGALVWLSIILMGTRSGPSATPNRSRVLVFGMYWYFVVGLWPILYTLVYLA